MYAGDDLAEEKVHMNQEWPKRLSHVHPLTRHDFSKELRDIHRGEQIQVSHSSIGLFLAKALDDELPCAMQRNRKSDDLWAVLSSAQANRQHLTWSEASNHAVVARRHDVKSYSSIECQMPGCC
jgi:hypothetical protein